MKDIQLQEVYVSGNRVEFRFRFAGELSGYFSESSMFVEYSTDIESVPKSLLSAIFTANMLPLVWMTDSILWVEELDRTFYECLHRLKQGFQDLYPQAKLGGRLVPAKLIDNDYAPTREALLLFSGGIDAHVSYLRLSAEKPLLMNIQGWYKSSPDSRQEHVAEMDRRDIASFAQSEAVEFEFVKSNFAVVLNSAAFDRDFHQLLGDSLWHGFQHSMNFITIAMPIAYLKRIRNIYIASSFSLGHVGQCASYPTTDNEYRFARHGGCVHDAFELSRQDKVHYLVDYQRQSGKPYPVRVCSFQDHNCCACDKCFRSVLEIVAENGDVRDFGFDIPGSLKDYYADVMERQIVKFDIEGESRKHWPDTIDRMKQNYDQLVEKEFVDWFLNFDFKHAKKRAVRKYYFQNFFSILKRKLKERTHIR